MLNYYDELKNDILEALKEEKYKEVIKQITDKHEAYCELEDKMFVDDAITGNASGSYYFSSYKSRKHCYSFFRDVFDALEGYGYNEKLEKFKTFVSLVEGGYLNIENMTLNYDLLDGVDEDEQCYIYYALEEIEDLDFDALDVITRCYMLPGVISGVVENFLK